jgi:hypothetical protein
MFLLSTVVLFCSHAPCFAGEFSSLRSSVVNSLFVFSIFVIFEENFDMEAKPAAGVDPRRKSGVVPKECSVEEFVSLYSQGQSLVCFEKAVKKFGGRDLFEALVLKKICDFANREEWKCCLPILVGASSLSLKPENCAWILANSFFNNIQEFPQCGRYQKTNG